MEVKSPRGTSDILPGEVELWQRVEAVFADVMGVYGYREIRTPVFEATELFSRGVGATTDIVEKQMYTFDDRGGRSLTLRPEGTAPVVRAVLQHRLYGEGLPRKYWYIQPMFRYERPQAGRARQFHQFGAEAIGSLDPACDVEMIAAPVEVYRRLGIGGHRVLVNSIGCPVCRPGYREALRAFLRDRLDALCPACRGRYDRNPLRILDCKEEGCRQASEGAPASRDHLCGECESHFAAVTGLLDAVEIPYTIEDRLVRGLDYYTKTVFEIVTDALGAQDALGGGGRYDGLSREIGGPDLPAVGFAAGIERAVLVLKKLQGVEEAAAPRADLFLVALGEAPRREAIRIAHALRREGIAAAMEYLDEKLAQRSMKGQMKAAGRSGARFALIIGEEELARGEAALKDLSDGSQRMIALEGLVGDVTEALKG